MSTKEVPIDQNKVRSEMRELNIKGIKRGTISPFDMPRSAAISYNQNEKVFICEFNYMTSEALFPEQMGQVGSSTLIFHLGKNSGKLYKIELQNIERDQIPKITVEVVEVIDSELSEMRQLGTQTSKMLNFLSARKAIEKTSILSSANLARI